jgi:tetratricopeptide (TPR) repeat protein
VESNLFDTIDEIDEHLASLEFEEAQRLYEEARREFGDEPELLVLGAEIALERDDWEACVSRAEEGLDQELPDEFRAELLTLKAYALFYLDREEEARETFNEAVAHESDLWMALVGRATVHEHLGFLRAALLDLERAIRIDDQEPEPFAIRGEVHLQLGNREDAQRDFEYAIEIDPHDYESRLSLARLKAVGDEASRSVELLEPLVDPELEPDVVVPAAILRSQMSLTLGSTEVALEDAQIAIDALSDDPWGYLQKAAAQIQASKPGDAIATLKEADQRVPGGENVPDIDALRASAYEQLGKQEKAETHRERGQGTARLPEIVYGPELNPARHAPVDPNQPISVERLLGEIFGDPDQAPPGYAEEVREMLDRIPEIAEENPDAEQVEIELPPLEPGGESPGKLTVELGRQ